MNRYCKFIVSNSNADLNASSKIKQFNQGNGTNTGESYVSAALPSCVVRDVRAPAGAGERAEGNTAVNDPLKLPVTGAIAVWRSQARAFLLKRASAVVSGRPRGLRQRNDKRNSATFTVKTAPGHRTLSALCFLRARPRRGEAGPRAAPGPRG